MWGWFVDTRVIIDETHVAIVSIHPATEIFWNILEFGFERARIGVSKQPNRWLCRVLAFLYCRL